MNFSYSVVPDVVYSVLEPCCGAINACLPILKPVGNKLAESRIFSSLRSTIRGSSENSSTNKNLSEPKHATIGGSEQKKKLHRLDEEEFDVDPDDQYPLTNLSVGGVESNFRADTRW